MENQKQRVYDALEQLKIKYEVVEHEPVHTMEDMDRLGLPQKGTLCKNLFLRDAKGKRHFLVTCDEKKTVDLKTLGRQLGALFSMHKILFYRPSLNPNFMLMLVLIKCVYQLHDSFCIRLLLTAIYKFPFYMLQARDACDIGISIAFELPVR